MMRKNAAWRILTLRCEEASRLASMSLDGPLPRADRVALRLHLWICSSCRRFLRQILQMRQMTGRCSHGDEACGPALPTDVRDRIKQSLGEGGISGNSPAV